MGELSPYFIRRTALPRGEQPLVLLDQPVGEDRPEPGFWDFWRVIRKHKRLIALFFFTVVVTVGVGTLLMTPIYTSQTTLLIEEKGPQIVDIKQVLSESIGATDKHDYYDTQYEILKSASIAAQVIREQHLASNKIFTGEERTGIVAGSWSSLKQWLKTQAWVRAIRSWFDGEPESSEEILTKLTRVYLKDYLDVEPLKNTRLVRIAFSTPDRDLSTQLANAHAQAYIRQGLQFRALANADAEQFLEKKLAELKGRVEKSEAALNDYRRDKGIISLDDKENVVVDRLADLNKRLTEAEADKITLQSQVQLIRRRAFDSLPAVINNPLITSLKTELSKLEGEYANLSAEYNLGYPKFAQVKAQLDQTRKRLRDEIQSVVGGIESAYLAADAKDKGLRQKMTEQRNAALQLKDASVEYAILAREVETNNQLYNSILQRTNEMRVAGAITSSNVYVVDEAKPPLEPSRPRRALNLLIGVLLGAMGGVALAFFVEYLDKTVSRPEEIERYFHLPTLAVVPDFFTAGKRDKASLLDVANGNGFAGISPNGSGNGRSHGNELVIDQAPMSLVAESYRALQTSMLLSQAAEPPRVVLFTSGLRDEGKTATAVNTAIVFAQMEAKVLVIDADLRMSACHKRLFLERAPGLAELLTGQRTAEEVIKATLTDNLYVITGGAVPPDPVKLVGSRKMHEVITGLREQFDYIFIDSPPLIAVSDAVRLSTMVDGVVLVVKGEETPRDVLKDACARLQYAQAKVLGVVLNRVDMNNGDYHYYHRDLYRTAASPAAT
jgi:capsular exopolysaccharide synthesis family protein